MQVLFWLSNLSRPLSLSVAKPNCSGDKHEINDELRGIFHLAMSLTGSAHGVWAKVGLRSG
jgi:hypothetical protein